MGQVGQMGQMGQAGQVGQVGQNEIPPPFATARYMCVYLFCATKTTVGIIGVSSILLSSVVVDRHVVGAVVFLRVSHQLELPILLKLKLFCSFRFVVDSLVAVLSLSS